MSSELDKFRDVHVFIYHIVKHDVIWWDLFVVMLAMAKVGAMIYFRRTN